MLPIVVVLIFVALTFDFINGFHDAANSIATVVSTRVLSPGKAVAWAAFFNFVAAFGFGTAVATTIGKGMIDVKVITFAVVFAGLAGAILWDLITWYFGLPTSSSHALMGGYAGAAVARAGWGEDVDLHRALAAHRHGRRPRADDRHHVDHARSDTGRRRSLVPPAAADFSGRVQPQPRYERRAEDDGNCDRVAAGSRVHHGVQGADLGDSRGARGDRARYARRRLADYSHDGLEDHKASAGRRVRC